jgi:hypothetical protein
MGIAGKLTWVSIGPRQIFDDYDHPDRPRVTFDHFWYRGERGPLLVEKYPALASRMYDKNVRALMHRRLRGRMLISIGMSAQFFSLRCPCRRINRSNGAWWIPEKNAAQNLVVVVNDFSAASCLPTSV